MSPLDLENWDFLAIHRAFCCCVFSLSGFYTAARCEHYTALSRADLWTFASAVAVEWGLDRNNNACDGSDTAGDGVSTSQGFSKS